MADVRANLEIFAALLVLGASLLLVAVSVIAYTRLRTARALLVGLGFLGLAAKGAYLTSVSWSTRGAEPWVLPMAMLDLWVVLLFYLAMRQP